MSELTLEDIRIGDSISLTLYGAMSGGVSTFSGELVSRTNSAGLPLTSTVPTDHVNIYRDLPADVKEMVPDDYSAYNYLGLKLEDGTTIYIGEPWIILSTVTINTLTIATVKLLDFRDTDVEPVKALLKSNGYIVDTVHIN